MKFGSFTEIDFEIIKSYLNNLPSGVLGITQINSNAKSKNTSNHIEVACNFFLLENNIIKIFRGSDAAQSISDLVIGKQFMLKKISGSAYE